MVKLMNDDDDDDDDADDKELTLNKIKFACKEHFGMKGRNCDILTGERGPLTMM